MKFPFPSQFAFDGLAEFLYSVPCRRLITYCLHDFVAAFFGGNLVSSWPEILNEWHGDSYKGQVLVIRLAILGSHCHNLQVNQFGMEI